ncbi:MAG TPA: HAMP domain-containing sensor histidine kinase [Vicinamibacterales bacterium]|nr:HAMP domain-containing sensor histidine kinase [Vicinamibacterales bacterium]
MSNDAVDPRWPRLLSLAVHEFRTPITVVAGYIRLVLKERAGPISDQQRKLLEEAEKSCGRLSALVAEMSDLSALEAGSAAVNRAPLDVAALLRDVIAAMPELPDRAVSVVLEGADGPVTVAADHKRLSVALAALLTALRRELVTSDRLIVRLAGSGGDSMAVIAIGDPEQVTGLAAADPASLETFDEWRGGSGLGLAIARRVIGQHGGSLRSPAGGGKAAALVALPRA